MARRNTLPIDADPLSVVVPEDRDGRNQHRTSRSPERQRRTPTSQKKVRVAFYLSEDLAEAIRDGVVYLSGPPHRLTMTSFAEMAFQKELERLQTEYHGGKPFPQREEDLKGGRPIR